MSPRSALQIHAIAHPIEGGQGLAVTVEEARMHIDDATVDDITKTRVIRS